MLCVCVFFSKSKSIKIKNYFILILMLCVFFSPLKSQVMFKTRTTGVFILAVFILMLTGQMIAATRFRFGCFYEPFANITFYGLGEWHRCPTLGLTSLIRSIILVFLVS
jgi:hypothetical protein